MIGSFFIYSFISSSKFPPKIVGIAKTKEKATASFMCHPLMQPADIVVPLLESPGISAKACINPINNISLIFLLREEFIFFSSRSFEAKKRRIEVHMKKSPISSILWVRTLIGWKNKYIGISGAIAIAIKIMVFFSLKII